MPWYYVLTKPGNFAQCIESEEPPPPLFFTIVAGPFPSEKDCVNCLEEGLCGGSNPSTSGSDAANSTVPNGRFLCKTLQQIKYGRDVWALQCRKRNRVLAKNVGDKLNKDYYVTTGCKDTAVAKFMWQRKFNRDVYVVGERCCDDGSGSGGSESISESSSASASASASASSSSSVSSASSGSIPPSGSISPSVSGSTVSGSAPGIFTSCCPNALPTTISAVVFSSTCPQYNGTYTLTLTDENPVGCEVGQVWENRPPPSPGENCIDPPYIALVCCDGVLTVRFELSNNDICLAPFPLVCEEYLVRECDPLLVQMQVSNKTWYSDGFPPITCCVDNPDFLITIL